MLDQWLESLGDDDDVEDAEMPEHLTCGGMAVAAYYVDANSAAWPLPLSRLLGAVPAELDVQLAAETQQQPLRGLQVSIWLTMRCHLSGQFGVTCMQLDSQKNVRRGLVLPWQRAWVSGSCLAMPTSCRHQLASVLPTAQCQNIFISLISLRS